MIKLNEMYDNHKLAEHTTIFQRARILNSAKHRFTQLDTYEEIRLWIHKEIVEASINNPDL